MTRGGWKALAYATVVAASSVVGTDQPLVTGAHDVPAAPSVVAMVNPHVVNAPKVLDAIEPPAVTGTEDPPIAADTTNPPIAVAPPAVPVAQEPPAVMRADKPPVATTPSVTAKRSVATPAENPPAMTDMASPPVAASASDAPPPARAAANPPVADAEKPAPTFDRRILAAHNRERQDLGLEPLSWNPALAESAKRWADHLAQTGRFEHAPENRSAPEGENLWAGSKGYYTPEAMVGAWIREKRFFRPGLFPDNSVTGRVEDIGHYTQVVWRATREVGCAEAASAAEDILVCRYAEAGNYRGEQPF